MTLTRLTAAVWASWLGLLGLLAAMVVGRVGHPHFLPATALLGAMAVPGYCWRRAASGD